MDSFPHDHQREDRRIIGPSMDGFGGDHHHQWYPSSSPQPPPQPPPSASVYYNHYLLPPPPPPPQQQQFYHHHHHPYPPPPYHNQFSPPPLPRPIAMSHHHPPTMPPPSAFPPPPLPNQARGNPSWAEHQGWEYPESSIPYNNVEDWAARAKAWASEQSGIDNHHTQSQFTLIGVDEHNYTYRDQYQTAVGPTRDGLQPSFPQSSNQQLPASTCDPPKQVNHLHDSTSFSFGSYGTGYSSGGEPTRTNAEHMASPQKNYHPSLSIYEQEVSYNYSSAPGNRETIHRSEGLHVPLALPVSSLPEGQHSRSVQMSSAEQPHFSHHGPPTNFLPDACSQPTDFQGRHVDHESHQKIYYGPAGSDGAVGIVDHDPAAPTVPTWAPTAPGVGFPQFDPTFIPQAPLPVQRSPAFGGFPASNFPPIVPPVSVPYGVVPGLSLQAVFNGESNGALNLSERPKKAAVPNWLREEIIKKKLVIPNAVSAQPIGNSFNSFESKDGDKSLNRADHGDSKSMDSTRSTEDDDDDDEENVEAARSAAINQEMKRVLTEILLKVTDELFDEIATNVLDEDAQRTSEESIIDGKQQVSPPRANPTPKAAAKVLIPVRVETTKLDSVGENSSTSSSGGNILGLANYDSDNDDDEIQSSKLSSVNQVSSSHQHDSNGKPAENDYASVKDEADINGMAQRFRAEGSPSVENSKYPYKDSVLCDEPASVNGGKVKEVPSDAVNSSQSNATVGAKDDRGKESVSVHAKRDKLHAKDYQYLELERVRSPKNPQNKGDNKAGVEKTSHKTSEASDSIIHEDKLREKMEKRDRFKERAYNKSSERGSKLIDSDPRRSSKDSIEDTRKETTEDKKDKYREGSERKTERVGNGKEDRTTRARKDSSRYNSRRSPPPSSRGKNSKDNSFSRSNVSGDEPSDNSKKRKQQSYNSSLSPSPTKSRKRQDSRSPRSKHAYGRISPYSCSERRKRSRSRSPVHRRSGADKRSR